MDKEGDTVAKEIYKVLNSLTTNVKILCTCQHGNKNLSTFCLLHFDVYTCPGLTNHFLSKAEPLFAASSANKKEHPEKRHYFSFLRATLNIDIEAYFVRLVTPLWTGGTYVQTGLSRL